MNFSGFGDSIITILAVVFLGVVGFGFIDGIYHIVVDPHVPSDAEICHSKGGYYIYNENGPDTCVKTDSIIPLR